MSSLRFSKMSLIVCLCENMQNKVYVLIRSRQEILRSFVVLTLSLWSWTSNPPRESYMVDINLQNVEFGMTLCTWCWKVQNFSYQPTLSVNLVIISEERIPKHINFWKMISPSSIMQTLKVSMTWEKTQKSAIYKKNAQKLIDVNIRSCFSVY